MGVANSKLKKKKHNKTVSSSIATDSKESIDIESQKKHSTPEHNAEEIKDSEENVNEEDLEPRPTLKWKRATPNEDIVRIQQAAEIKDIEAIYENSTIHDGELMNKMPDHFWAGRENQLPRYVEYRGDDRLAELNHKVRCPGNLLRMSSLSNLTDTGSLNVRYAGSEYDSDDDSDNNLSSALDSRNSHRRGHRKYRSISCPQLRHYFLATAAAEAAESASVDDASVFIIANAAVAAPLSQTLCLSPSSSKCHRPKKGILKNRAAARPISALITEHSMVAISSEAAAATGQQHLVENETQKTSRCDAVPEEKPPSPHSTVTVTPRNPQVAIGTRLRNKLLHPGNRTKTSVGEPNNGSEDNNSDSSEEDDYELSSGMGVVEHRRSLTNQLAETIAATTGCTLSGYFDDLSFTPDGLGDAGNDNNSSITTKVAVVNTSNNTPLKVNKDRKKQILSNLNKKLNLRPSSVELTNRNILHTQSETERYFGFEERRVYLNEKLSSRPTISELKTKKIIKFSDFIEVKETDNYDRRVNKTWARLTDEDRENIRMELNELKREMVIHTKSRVHTRFYEPLQS